MKSYRGGLPNRSIRNCRWMYRTRGSVTGRRLLYGSPSGPAGWRRGCDQCLTSIWPGIRLDGPPIDHDTFGSDPRVLNVDCRAVVLTENDPGCRTMISHQTICLGIETHKCNLLQLDKNESLILGRIAQISQKGQNKYGDKTRGQAKITAIFNWTMVC